MTTLDKPIHRLTRGSLSSFYGSDSGKPLVATLDPGDLVTMRPRGTRRAISISLFDVYAQAIRSQVNATRMEKLRVKKAKLAERLTARKFKREIKQETENFRNSQ